MDSTPTLPDNLPRELREVFAARWRAAHIDEERLLGRLAAAPEFELACKALAFTTQEAWAALLAAVADAHRGVERAPAVRTARADLRRRRQRGAERLADIADRLAGIETDLQTLEADLVSDQVLADAAELGAEHRILAVEGVVAAVLHELQSAGLRDGAASLNAAAASPVRGANAALEAALESRKANATTAPLRSFARALDAAIAARGLPRIGPTVVGRLAIPVLELPVASGYLTARDVLEGYADAVRDCRRERDPGIRTEDSPSESPVPETVAR
jgi:hypothetical protein